MDWFQHLKFDYKLFKGFLYDFAQYRKHYARTGNYDRAEKLEARIIMYYHVLEKGLSHPKPRKKFGVITAEKLYNLIVIYNNNYDPRTQVSIAIDVLKAYVSNDKGHRHLSQRFIENVLNLQSASSIPLTKAYELKSKKEYFNDCDKPYAEFVKSRHSCRDFTEKNISIKRIQAAVELARYTPSVCNRQTCKIHLVRNKDLLTKAIKLQNGSRSFHEKINQLLIVVSDVSFFVNIDERFQCYIDGGIFAMSVLNALHYQKIAAVPLNWSHHVENDQKLRALGFVKPSEKVILMIGIGEAPVKFKIATSLKRSANELLVLHD